MTVPEQLTQYLRNCTPQQVPSGELQRLNWKNENGTIATPRSVVRRLQELVSEGILVVEHRKNHAYYSYGAPKKIRWEFDEVLVEGRIIRKPRKTLV